MQLFSQLAAPGLGSAAPCLSAPSCVSGQASAPDFSPSPACTLHDAAPGSFGPTLGGVRIEDMILVRDDKPESLTQSKKELLIL